MSIISDKVKISYLFKKNFDIVSTNSDLELFQESNYIQNNHVNSKSIIYANKHLNRDTISESVPIELFNITKDDANNNIENSLLGKSSHDGLVKKYVKLSMDYIKGSTKYDNSNNIISISFYHRLLENSIPYNYDIKIVISINYIKIMMMR